MKIPADRQSSSSDRRTWELDAKSDNGQTPLDHQRQADQADNFPNLIRMLYAERTVRVGLAFSKQLPVSFPFVKRQAHTGNKLCPTHSAIWVQERNSGSQRRNQ